MMKKMKITQMDYIKANRKASRDEEIAEHGWPSRQHAIHKSKKVYDRKRMKAGLKDLPFHLSIAIKTRETTDVVPVQANGGKLSQLGRSVCG